MFCVILLFVTPRKLEFSKFFKRRGNNFFQSCAQMGYKTNTFTLTLNVTGNVRLPMSTTKTCLTWKLVQKNVNWSVLFIIGKNKTERP